MILIRLSALFASMLIASLAAAQSTSGPIHACVTPKTGKLRIVASAADCGAKENHIAWNRDVSPQLVGLTTATFKGDLGLIGFTQACQQEFPATRFCTSEEIVRTTSVPAGLSGTAWVLVSGVPSPGNGTIVDVSGAANTPLSMTCEGWIAASGSSSGLTVEFGASTKKGSFSTQLCSEERKVACCGWTSE